jgi:hypothetical protein
VARDVGLIAFVKSANCAAAPGSLRGVTDTPGVRPVLEPLRVRTVTVLGIGTALWFGFFCVLLVLVLVQGWQPGTNRSDWFWTALAGWLLGLLGMYVAHVQQRPRPDRPPAA